MSRPATTMGLIALTAAITAGLAPLIIPGCTANQDNSPINIRNSQGQMVLGVACSTDGSVADVADGRNVYRYASIASGQPQSRQCILSQAERLELAVRHDPNEQQQAPPR